VRRLSVAAVVLAMFVAVGCDSTDTRTTARVLRLDGARVCLVPEDPAQRGLIGCYPFAEADRSELRAGACIEAVIPNRLEAAKRSDAIRRVRVLDRTCR